MKLVLLDDSDLSFRIEKELSEIDNFIFYHKNDYLVKSKHYNMYKDVFNKCENEGIEKIIFPQDIADIDILLNEVRERNIKIVFRVPFREVIRSKVREKSFIELLNLPQVERCLIFNVEYIKEYDKYNKCVYLTDPINEKKEWYNIERTNKEFTVLFFGRITEAKGIHYFNESSKHNNLRYLAVGSSEFYDKKSEFNNIIHVDEFIPDDKIPEIFINSDIVVMPYLDYYKFGSSGILPQACFAKKPVIVSDIYPFNSLVNNYKLGYIWKDRDPKSLSDCIVKLYDNYDKIVNESDFNGYINSLLSWLDISFFY